MIAGTLAVEPDRLSVLLSDGSYVVADTADLTSVEADECADDLRGFVLLFGDLGRTPDEAVEAWMEEWDLRELASG